MVNMKKLGMAIQNSESVSVAWQPGRPRGIVWRVFLVKKLIWTKKFRGEGRTGVLRLSFWGEEVVIMMPLVVRPTVRTYLCIRFLCSLPPAVLFLIYFPTATVSYFTLGDCVQESMLNSLSEGTLKDVAQALILLHLIAATPICLNPPNQWLESLFNIPTGKVTLCLLVKRWHDLLTETFCFRVHMETLCVQNIFADPPVVHRTEHPQLWCHSFVGRRQHCHPNDLRLSSTVQYPQHQSQLH